MKKIGVLVLGAKAPLILRRVLRYFDDRRFRFFLHIDQKIDLKSYVEELDSPARIMLVEPRVKVFWGGFSMIEAEISLLRMAMDDPEIDRFVLWSDDCAPLRSPDDVFRALADAPDRIAREVREYTQDWYRNFHFPDSNFTSMIKHLDGRTYEAEDWDNIQKLEAARRRGKKKLKAVFFSRQWWALSRESAETMLRTLEDDEHLLESFRYSMFADETCFATLHQMCFPEASPPDVPMYADYDRPPVPFVFTRPNELPDVFALPAHYLFLRKIWPWSTELVDRLARGWGGAAILAKTGVTGPAAAPTDEAHERALEAAIEARDDGDVAESAEMFAAVLAARPEDSRAALEYANTLKKLKRMDDADRVLAPAMERDPTNLQLRAAWAEVPVYVCDHAEVVRRERIYRGLFPPVLFASGWHNLAIEFGSLSEMLRWDDLARAVKAERESAVRHAPALRICLWQATELGLIEEQKAISKQAAPEAWGQLPAEAKGNVRLRVALAALNQALVAEAGVRLISIGQNCLPFLVGGRWGLLPAREKPEETTPFDRGAFQKDNAASVIESDFAGFDDRTAYVEGRSWDQQRMYRHEATGVYFYHERGKFWFENESARFFAHVDRMIAKWREVSRAGRRLFMFCLCGEGDPARLVEAMTNNLLSVDAHLIVLDVLQQPHDCPAHDRVSYLPLPYPTNYVWDDFYHQCEARGLGFELAVMLPIMDYMMSFLPAERAAFYAAERVRILHYYARAAVEWRHDHENGMVLYGYLHRLAPERETALSYAKALRDNGRVEEARAILEEVAAREPADYQLRLAWAEAGVAPFDWAERLARLRVLRAEFPPEQEPRSWDTLAEELKILTEHGGWEELLSLLQTYWQAVLTMPKLLRQALDGAVQLGELGLTRRLLDEAAPEALPGQALAGLEERLSEAERNIELVKRAGAHVLVLGQNALPGMMVTRWGLRGAPRTYDAVTPFEVGDFHLDTAADAIADDFAALSQPDDYVESKAWGGGVSPRHDGCGVTFMLHRAARLGEAEGARFRTHLHAMVAQWRKVRGGPRRIYLHLYSEKGDRALLIAAMREAGLLRYGSKLVIIDQREDATDFPDDPDVVFMHAPQPRNYPWFSTFGSATPDNVAYERRVLEPVIAILNDFCAKTELLLASSA